MTDAEEIKKREKQMAVAEARGASQQTGKANQDKEVEGIVVKDVNISFSSALTLTFKFFFAGLFIAIPIWLIMFFLVP